MGGRDQLVGAAKARGEPELGSFARGACDADFSAHEVREFFRDGQAQAGAPVAAGYRCVHLREFLKQQGLFVRRDPDAGIADSEAHHDGGIRLRDQAGPHGNFAPRGELYGIPREVDEHLAQAAGIASEGDWHIRRGGTDKLEAFVVGMQGHDVGKVFQDGRKVEVHDLQFELSGFYLGEVQEVVDDAEEGFAAGAHSLGAVALLAVEFGVQQQAGHADDTVHGRPDFMADVGQEIALGDVRAFRPGGGLFQVRIGLLRDVSREGQSAVFSR